MKYIYKGTSFMQRGRRVQLKEVEHIFDCPHCEYVMTGLNEENIVTVRNTHVRICHPEKLVGMHFEDSFGELIDE